MEDGMAAQAPASDRSDFGATLMMLGALAPVVGAVMSAPMLGFTIVFLALFDSAQLWFLVR
jgi:hypothetical protein